MRTREHWEECKALASYHAANNVALQLKELAKKEGYDPRGVKVLDKEHAGPFADSMVTWEEGPIGWALFMEMYHPPGVCVDRVNDHILTFYDI